MDGMTYETQTTNVVNVGVEGDHTEEKIMDAHDPTWTVVWTELVEFWELVEDDSGVWHREEYFVDSECSMVFLDEENAMKHLRYLWAHDINAHMLHNDEIMSLPGMIGNERIWFTRDVVD